MKKLIVLLVAVSFLFSCGEDDGDITIEPFTGKEYAVLNIGQESVFQIDSTIYNEFTGRVNLKSLQQKESVVRIEKDAANRDNYIVEISTRAADTLPWRLNRVTKRIITDFRYEVLDNNVLSVPLVFPVELSKKWNSNVLNAFGEKEYEYTDVNKSFNSTDCTYDSTVTVLQFIEINLVEQQQEEEVFATGVGLIFRTHKDLETEPNGDIRSGFESTMKLIAFKK